MPFKAGRKTWTRERRNVCSKKKAQLYRGGVGKERTHRGGSWGPLTVWPNWLGRGAGGGGGTTACQRRVQDDPKGRKVQSGFCQN